MHTTYYLPDVQLPFHLIRLFDGYMMELGYEE